MATGLIALLDDVAAIAKLAAASLDDIAVQTARATTKAAGIVIDDAAVTPRYVVGGAVDYVILSLILFTPEDQAAGASQQGKPTVKAVLR